MTQPDAIDVLAAGIKQQNGRFVSTDLTAADDTSGAPGGKLRILAVAVLADRYPGAAVVTSGGVGYDIPSDVPKDRPLLCEIMRDELLDAGVPAGRIILESASNNTYQQLGELEKIAAKNHWNKIAIVSNRWHVPRIASMLKAKFPKLQSMAELVSAEDVLIASDKRVWEAPIAQAYGSAFMKARMERERRGVEQIADGTYEFQ